MYQICSVQIVFSSCITSHFWCWTELDILAIAMYYNKVMWTLAILFNTFSDSYQICWIALFSALILSRLHCWSFPSCRNLPFIPSPQSLPEFTRGTLPYQSSLFFSEPFRYPATLHWINHACSLIYSKKNKKLNHTPPKICEAWFTFTNNKQLVGLFSIYYIYTCINTFSLFKFLTICPWQKLVFVNYIPRNWYCKPF